MWELERIFIVMEEEGDPQYGIGLELRRKAKIRRPVMTGVVLRIDVATNTVEIGEALCHKSDIPTRSIILSPEDIQRVYRAKECVLRCNQ